MRTRASLDGFVGTRAGLDGFVGTRAGLDGFVGTRAVLDGFDEETISRFRRDSNTGPSIL